jgi:uncharacterized protein
MTTKKPAIVTCPQCHAEVVWDSKTSPFRPFCSERCKLIDLGQWAAESYRVPVEAAPDQDGDISGHA